MTLLPLRSSQILLVLSIAVLLSSCSTSRQQEEEAATSPRTVDKTVPKYKNPYPLGTYEHFVASKDYPQTYGTFRNEKLLKDTTAGARRIVICLDEQRGRLYAGNKVALDFPISTGVRAHPTYTGSYKVIGKSVSHSSNLYGKIYNAEGKCVNYNAESSDPVPEGGRYAGSSMPYWQRLTNAGLGLHVGKVRRRPQSHGCVRLQSATGKELFGQTQLGTSVIIRRSPESSKNPFVAPPVQKEKPAVSKASIVKSKPVQNPSTQPEKKKPEPPVGKPLEAVTPSEKKIEPKAPGSEFAPKIEEKVEKPAESSLDPVLKPMESAN